MRFSVLLGLLLAASQALAATYSVNVNSACPNGLRSQVSGYCPASVSGATNGTPTANSVTTTVTTDKGSGEMFCMRTASATQPTLTEIANNGSQAVVSAIGTVDVLVGGLVPGAATNYNHCAHRWESRFGNITTTASYATPDAGYPTSLQYVAFNYDGSPTATDDLHFGMHIAPGVLTDLDDVAVRLTPTGPSVAAYVAETLAWHTVEGTGSSRSIAIQINDVDMSGGDVAVYVDFDRQTDAHPDIARLTKQPYEHVLAPASHQPVAETSENGFKRTYMPKTIVMPDDLSYFEDAKIEPPYKVQGAGTMWNTWISGAVDSAQKFDAPSHQAYNTYGGNDFQYDRAHSLFNMWLSTKDRETYKEFLAMSAFYVASILTIDTSTSGNSGYDNGLGNGGSYFCDGIGSGGRGGVIFQDGSSKIDGDCHDSKNIFAGGLIDHMALTGNTQPYDAKSVTYASLWEDMSAQSRNGNFQSSEVHSIVNDECTRGTERAYGFNMQNQAEVCMALGTTSAACARFDALHESLRDMQISTNKPWDTTNNWPVPANYFRHSQPRHEVGSCSPGDDDERAGSSWMSTMPMEGWWRALWLGDASLFSGHSTFTDSIVRMGTALNNYAFDMSPLGEAAPMNNAWVDEGRYDPAVDVPYFGCNEATVNFSDGSSWPRGPFPYYFFTDLTTSNINTYILQNIYYSDAHSPELTGAMNMLLWLGTDSATDTFLLNRRLPHGESMLTNCPGSEWNNPTRAIHWATSLQYGPRRAKIDEIEGR